MVSRSGCRSWRFCSACPRTEGEAERCRRTRRDLRGVGDWAGEPYAARPLGNPAGLHPHHYLEAAGSSFEKVVRTPVQVARLPRDAAVETDVIALA